MEAEMVSGKRDDKRAKSFSRKAERLKGNRNENMGMTFRRPQVGERKHLVLPPSWEAAVG